MTEVTFIVYTGEEYDRAIEVISASPGWLETAIIDIEAYAEHDPLAEMTAYFENEQHALMFRLRMGV